MKRTPKATSRPSTRALLLLVAATACQRFPDVEYQTQHLQIGTEFDAPLCQGNLDHYERVIALVEEQLGAELHGTVELYLWDSREDPSRPDWCPGAHGTSCHRDGVVYSSLLSADHELVHAVIGSFASPSPFWSEGAAEAFQSARTSFVQSSPLSNLELGPPELSYAAAGHFTRWLVDAYGIDKYRALVREKSGPRSAFESTYGISFEEAQERYYDEAPYSYGVLLPCSYPDLVETGDLTWSETLDIDCANEHVISNPDAIGTWRTLTIDERGFYELSTSAEFGVIQRCQDEDLAQPVLLGDAEFGDIPPLTQYAVGQYTQLFGPDGEPAVYDLAPGRYEIGAGFYDHDSHSATLDVRAAPGPVPRTP